MCELRDGLPALGTGDLIAEGAGSYLTMAGRSPEPTQAVSSRVGRTFALRLQAEAAPASWRCEALFMDMDDLGIAGVM